MYDLDNGVITPEETAIIDVTEDDEVWLPEGWAPGDDVLADPSTWKGPADAQANEEGTSEEVSEGEAPTTEPVAGDGQGAKAEALPTTQKEAEAPRKLKFQATIDHKTEDVEIDESELPTLYQKAKNLDRAQERTKKASATVGKLEKLAKALEYSDTDDFFSGTVDNLIEQRKNELISEGVHSAVAERMARQDYAELLSDVKVSSVPSRDFAAETQELLSAHPELGPSSPVPNEVVSDAARPGGPTLLQAYENYLAKKQASMKKTEKAELDALRKENKTLKQNAEAASRAPVTSALKGGATKEMADDPFLKGFLDDSW